MLALIASCLVADSTNIVEQGLLITADWVLMISHAALGGQARQPNRRWTGKGLLLAESTFTFNNFTWWKFLEKEQF